MNSQQRNKLNRLLELRRDKMQSINYFAQYFEEFAYSALKVTVVNINMELESVTSEGLKIFYDNPYFNTRSRYFVMIQLFSSNHRRNVFALDNTAAFPSLLFEGDEFTGRVKATTKFEDKVNASSEYEILQLRDANFVSDVVISFLETIYSI